MEECHTKSPLGETKPVPDRVIICVRYYMRQSIKVFDFFCGCGGTSAGLSKAGMDIVFGLDIDSSTKETFCKNLPDARFCQKRISKLTDDDIQPLINKQKDHHTLFCGCAPCQPFTKQNTERPKRDVRRSLLAQFGLVIRRYRPDFVFVENVPGLQKVQKNKVGPFPGFKRMLKALDYHFDFGIVAAQDYGAPQLRRRFILLASRLGPITIPPPSHGTAFGNPYQTVRDAIADLPEIDAGTEYAGRENIHNHRAADLSPLNLKRIRKTRPDGGGRCDWPKGLIPKCYTKKNAEGKTHAGHTDCYGRLWWDKPATGLTTRCISYSNGRFGHPEQNRAISIREAARLQGFDDDFVFTGSLNSMARQIGNAVPVDLACAMGIHFAEHLKGAQNNGPV